MNKKYKIVDQQNRLWATATLRMQAHEILARLQKQQPDKQFFIVSV